MSKRSAQEKRRLKRQAKRNNLRKQRSSEIRREFSAPPDVLLRDTLKDTSFVLSGQERMPIHVRRMYSDLRSSVGHPLMHAILALESIMFDDGSWDLSSSDTEICIQEAKRLRHDNVADAFKVADNFASNGPSSRISRAMAHFFESRESGVQDKEVKAEIVAAFIAEGLVKRDSAILRRIVALTGLESKEGTETLVDLEALLQRISARQGRGSKVVPHLGVLLRHLLPALTPQRSLSASFLVRFPNIFSLIFPACEGKRELINVAYSDAPVSIADNAGQLLHLLDHYVRPVDWSFEDQLRIRIIKFVALGREVKIDSCRETSELYCRSAVSVLDWIGRGVPREFELTREKLLPLLADCFFSTFSVISGAALLKDAFAKFHRMIPSHHGIAGVGYFFYSDHRESIARIVRSHGGAFTQVSLGVLERGMLIEDENVRRIFWGLFVSPLSVEQRRACLVMLVRRAARGHHCFAHGDPWRIIWSELLEQDSSMMQLLLGEGPIEPEILVLLALGSALDKISSVERVRKVLTWCEQHRKWNASFASRTDTLVADIIQRAITRFIAGLDGEDALISIFSLTIPQWSTRCEKVAGKLFAEVVMRPNTVEMLAILAEALFRMPLSRDFARQVAKHRRYKAAV